MSIVEYDKLIGSIELTNEPKDLCWDTPLSFAKALTDMMTISFPVNPNNDFIVIGRDNPSPDDNNKIWYRLDANRNPLGWHLFIKGKWRKVYDYNGDEVIWKTGRSDNVQPPFRLIDASLPGVSGNVLNGILSQYVESGTPGVYSYFAVRYVGY
jgi:hypothetical protein